jgi:hypothetical protein
MHEGDVLAQDLWGHPIRYAEEDAGPMAMVVAEAEVAFAPSAPQEARPTIAANRHDIPRKANMLERERYRL